MDGWRPLLHHHGRDHSPKLFIRFAACHTGYRCSLTDLTRLWDETLSTADIARRAERNVCSISPGDDATQLEIFYKMIRSAFHHHEGTAVEVVSGNQPSDDLTMSISAPLPSPLPLFMWKMHLALNDNSSELILAPALQLAMSQKSIIQHLTLQLRQKDHVIQKLLDTIDSANLHLDSVFMLPRLSVSKKIPQRDQFAKHVPGLAAYEDLPQQESDFSLDNLTQVLEDMPMTDEALAASLKAEPGWWHHLDEFDQSISTPVLKTGPSIEEDDTTDDDLEAYQSPQRSEIATAKEVANHGATGSPALKPTSPVKRRLGALGGHRAVSAVATEVSKDTSSTARPEVGRDHLPQIDPYKSPIHSSPKQESATSVEADTQEIRVARTEDSIGKKREETRATSEERANAKREELKKQLEEKAKAPAKKKRRF